MMRWTGLISIESRFHACVCGLTCAQQPLRCAAVDESERISCRRDEADSCREQ